jgi:hypothetical protein
MQKLNLTTTLIFGATLLLTIATWAETTDTTSDKTNQSVAVVPPAAPDWKVSAMSYYYDIKGKKAADSNDYDFGKLNSRIDLLNITYTVSPNWTLSLLAQHYEFYTETLFPNSASPVYQKSFDRTEGAGDTFLTAITPITYQNSWLVLGDFGLSIPTGTIGNKSNLPGLQDFNLAYNAQHGSGTYDIIGGITAMDMQPSYLFGSRLFADIRTGKNTNDYTLGNMYKLDTWFDYPVGYGFTPRVTGYYRHKEAIHGADKTRGELAADNFYRHSQGDWNMSAALKYQYQFAKSSIGIGAEVGVPFAQGSNNVDNSDVTTNYYSSISMNGAF